MLVRKDEIGLYVITNGSVYRPVTPTKHVAGAHVKGHHVSQTDRVILNDPDELWVGEYNHKKWRDGQCDSLLIQVQIWEKYHKKKIVKA